MRILAYLHVSGDSPWLDSSHVGRAALKIFAPRAVYGGGAIEYFLQPRRVFGRLLRDGHSSTGVHATYISSHI